MIKERNSWFMSLKTNIYEENLEKQSNPKGMNLS